MLLKKVGEIFGIDTKFIDKDKEREIKLQKKYESDIYYTTPGLTNDENITFVIGNELIKESTGYQIGKTVESTAQIGKYAGGIRAANYAINAGVKATQLTAEAAQYTAQAAQLTEKVNNMSGIAKLFDCFTKAGSAMAKEAAELGSKAASAEVAAAESAVAGTIGKCVSYGLIGVGSILGVGCGAYFTHKFCEETLDKFVEYFKNNSDKIKNTYKEAAEYFLN